MLVMVMMETPIRCLCPCRLRWSTGLCCRRPTTSPTPRLCAAWRGSPPPPLPPRFVRRGRRLRRLTADPWSAALPVTGGCLCPCAQFLAVPVGTSVHLYERDSWNHVSSLSDDLLTQVSAGPRPHGHKKHFFVFFALMLCMIQLVNCSSQSCLIWPVVSPFWSQTETGSCCFFAVFC